MPTDCRTSDKTVIWQRRPWGYTVMLGHQGSLRLTYFYLLLYFIFWNLDLVFWNFLFAAAWMGTPCCECPLERGAVVHICPWVTCGVRSSKCCWLLAVAWSKTAPRADASVGAAAEQLVCSTVSALAAWGIVSPRVRSYLRVKLLEMKIHGADSQTRMCLSGGDAAFADPSSFLQPGYPPLPAGTKCKCFSCSALLVSCPETSIQDLIGINSDRKS